MGSGGKFNASSPPIWFLIRGKLNESRDLWRSLVDKVSRPSNWCGWSAQDSSSVPILCLTVRMLSWQDLTKLAGRADKSMSWTVAHTCATLQCRNLAQLALAQRLSEILRVDGAFSETAPATPRNSQIVISEADTYYGFVRITIESNYHHGSSPPRFYLWVLNFVSLVSSTDSLKCVLSRPRGHDLAIFTTSVIRL